MSNVAFLLVALVISVLGVGVLWLRSRTTTTTNSTIDEFQEKMQALAPEPDEPDYAQDGVVRRRRNRRA